MFRRPGESPLDAAMRHDRERAQDNWERNMGGKYWLDNIPSGLTGQQGLQFEPSATFRQVRLEHNFVHKSRKGMVIHLDFDVFKSKDRTVTAAVHFFSANEAPLRDRNGEFCTANGQVCTWDYFRPGSISQRYKGARLFMPYLELHLPSGNHSLKFLAFIWDDQGSPLGWSDAYPFTVKIA